MSLTHINRQTKLCSTLEIFMCPKIDVADRDWKFVMFKQILMHAVAHWGCMNTVKGSALKLTVEEKSLAAARSETNVSSTLDPMLTNVINIPAPVH